MKSLKLPLFALGVGALTLGCDAQVGPEFEGESQFSLGGELVLGENSRDLVPALAFWLPQTKEVAIVDVEVSGSFPANFRLDLLTPPPEGALEDFNGSGLAAIGGIVVVPKDHPTTYPANTLTSHGYGVSCLQDICEVDRHACVGESCFEQDLECKPLDPCEVIEETGDPNLASDPSVERSTVYGGEDASDHSIEIVRECVDSGECHEVARRCPVDPEYSGLANYYPTTVTDCKVIAERGDPALAQPSASNLDNAIEGYSVVYAPRPFSFIAVDALSQLDFKQGYNLIGIVDAADDKTWLASIRCQEAAVLKAKIELDRRHGTVTASTTQGRAYLGITDAQQHELEELMLAAAKDCPAGARYEVVAHPETAGLKLHMGSRSGDGPF